MGQAVIIIRTELTAAELRALAARSDDADQTRRLLAIAMILAGASRADAARQTGMDRQTLRDWVHRYNQLGVDGLISRKSPGAAGKLTKAQMSEVRQWVLDGPDIEIHKVIRWRCVDLCAEVQRRFNVTVAKRTVVKWRFTRLQPRPYHPKKDAVAQEAFKKLQPPPERSTAQLHRRQAGGNLVPDAMKADTARAECSDWQASPSDRGASP